MPPKDRIRLRIEEETVLTPCRYTDPGNPEAGFRHAPVLRLTALVRLQPPPGRSGAIRGGTAYIDTGAWLSAIETQTWQDYERAGLLERLPLDGVNRKLVSIGGRATDFQLGRIWLSLHDLRLNHPPLSLPTVPVIVQLLLNSECRLPSPILLGLHLGILDGRKLTREPLHPFPGPIPPNHTSDVGAWYGQEWYLESA
jgi:hypothetical protein